MSKRDRNRPGPSALQRAESGASERAGGPVAVPLLGRINGRDRPREQPVDYEECLACQ